MRWIKQYIILISFLFISCEIVEPELDNPLDTEASAEKGVAPPALVFFPDNVSTNTGGNAVVNIYALEVENVAGIVAKVSYDNTKLNVASVSPGSFFSDSQNPIFITEDNIPEIHSILKSIDDKLYSSMKNKMKEVYENYFTLEGTCNKILQFLEMVEGKVND